MECAFSEFSYGYAAIREAESELSTIYRSRGAPVLPSLRAEADLGWDAKLAFVEYVLFVQFKRVQYVSRRHPGSRTWPRVGEPHYRFAIDTDGHQHLALLHLQSGLQSGGQAGEVLYAAPAFHTGPEFDNHYSSGSVLDNSILALPNDFPQSSGVHHYVSGRSGRSLVLSSPRPPQHPIAWRSLTAYAHDRAASMTYRAAQSVSIDAPTLGVGALEEVLMTSARILGRGARVESDAHPLRRIDRLAALLECGLVLMLGQRR